MPLSFHPTTSPLFLKLGKIIHAAKTLDTARRTTIPTEVEDVLDQFATGSVELQSIPDVLNGATAGWKTSGDGLIQQLAQVFQNTIIRYVKEDEQQPTDTLEDAIAELVRQMEETSTFVEQGAPTFTLAEVGTPNGDITLLVATTETDRFDRVSTFAYDETITIECTDDRTAGAEVLRFRGEPAASKFAHNWPAGSGCDISVTAVSPTDRRNIVTNGSFETADDDDATLPSGWLDGDGTAAALVTLPVAEVQTLAMTGTPTGGSYYVIWAHGGITQRTDPIAYNAGQSAVQAALRTLVGLEAVTVVTTGSTPNFTHTITFTGVPNPEQFTVNDDALTGGASPAVTPATTTAGEQAQFGARALKITSDGSGTGAVLYQRLTGLLPNTIYAVSLSHLLPVSAAAGALEMRLVDEIGGAAIVPDDNGANNNNALAIAHTEMTTTWQTSAAVFLTPAVVPDIVYLQIRVTTAFTNTRVVYLDSIRMFPATPLYDGGPSVGVLAGSPANGALLASGRFRVGDKFTLTVANSYADEMQQWFNRFCDMEALEQQLPNDGTSSSTDEVQTLTATPTVSGGQYKISFDGQTTADIAFDANNATILAALEALSNIAPGDVALGGGALPGTPVTFTFGGTYAGRNVPLMSIVAGTSPLSGGGSYAIAVTTPGVGYLSDSVFIT